MHFLLHKQDESTFQTLNIQTKLFVIVKNYNTNQVGKHYFINRSLSLKLLHKAKCEHEMQIFGITNPFSIIVVLNFKMIFALIVANLNFTNLPPHAIGMCINYGCLFSCAPFHPSL